MTTVLDHHNQPIVRNMPAYLKKLTDDLFKARDLEDDDLTGCAEKMPPGNRWQIVFYPAMNETTGLVPKEHQN